MKAVFGLFVILVGVSYGMLTSCDETQNRTLCYEALGGSFYFQIPTNAMDYDEFKITKNPYGNPVEVVKIKNNKVVVREYIKHRSTFYEGNGTFLIVTTERNDSDLYTLETFKNGNRQYFGQLHLFIEAPVSTPDLTTKCLTDGEMRVSCSSKGDFVQFNWTLIGDPLLDTERTVGNETNTITLKKGWSGILTCHVRNHVSNANHSIKISHCPGLRLANCTLINGTRILEWVNDTVSTLCLDPTTVSPTTVTASPTSRNVTGKGPGSDSLNTTRPSSHTQCLNNSTHTPNPENMWNVIIAGSLAGLMLVLVIVFTFYCVQKKKKPLKTPDLALSTVTGHSQDVEYADIRILKREMEPKERKTRGEVEYGQVKGSREPKPPMEVEYGQITILEGPRRKADKPEENCVYASVQKGQ